MTPAGPNDGGSNEPQPIIIVRRKRMEEDGHHGGAWKIAFADFMTAMMALFLVLWLVNASDADTRKAVASYFNPVKLVDRERSRRGLGSPGTVRKGEVVEPATSKPAGSELGEGTLPAAPSAGSATEARFLTQPDALLNEREAEALALDAAARTGDAPFETSLAAELRPDDPYAVEVTGKAAAAPEPKEEKPTPPIETDPEAETAGEIREAIREAVPNDPTLADAVEVTRVAGGTLVRLTDGPGYAMFDSGSFVPTGRTIIAMKAIAKVIAGREGGVRIEGHTDSVPFTGPATSPTTRVNDNWRLSTERAHAARLMLARGGLAPTRLAQVTGFAASRPLEGAAPDEARNRRIEILLEDR